MPVIEGADLQQVSTDREPLPEKEYTFDIYKVEESEDKKAHIIKHKIPEGEDRAGAEFWDYIYVKKNDGSLNDIGLKQAKRYLEAVFGKGSAEAEASPPDTDLLVGKRVKHFLKVKSFTRKDGTAGKGNESKKVSAA